jgi:DNA-binding PadR family transcriptional regulator
VLPLRTGTLYRALAAALDAGFIAEVPSRDEPRRRVYRLTAQGRNVLKADADRLADQVAQARAKRVLPERS